MICSIDGREYQVLLPKNVRAWDAMFMDYGGRGDLLHWKDSFSWCLERAGSGTYACCGSDPFGLGRRFKPDDFRGSQVGFRPVLAPVDGGGDPWPELADGAQLTFGTLYMGGKPVTVNGAPGTPVVPASYFPGTRLELGDSYPDPTAQITFVKRNGRLWADRNLLVDISWKDLSAQGFCTEEPPRARDGVKPICRAAEQYAWSAWKRFAEALQIIVIFAADEGEVVERALAHFGYPKKDWPRLSTGLGPIAVKRLTPTVDPQVWEV